MNTPETAKLFCKECADAENYYPPALLTYAAQTVNPQTYTWIHFPKKDFENNHPCKCNAYKLFELELADLIVSRQNIG